MPNLHPILLLGFMLLGAVCVAAVSNFVSTPVVLTVEAAPGVLPAIPPTSAGPVATPNHDPHPVSLALSPDTEPAPTEPAQAEPTTTVAAATPNHDPRHAHSVPSFALDPVALRAEPEPAAPSAPAAAPTFVDADTVLYAKGNARLRAAPNTEADVVTKLAADAPLHAVARSKDGAWWRVSLDGGQVGYVHRAAVTKDLLVKTVPAAAPAPVVAVAAPKPVPARRAPGVLSYVEETMNWLADTAGRGTAPKAIRPER